MTVKIIKGAGHLWRPYRFPPLTTRASQNPAAAGGDPAALQRAIADGFQEGVEKGYQEGLAQGQEAGRREGYENGYAEGLRQGQQEGRAQGRARFEELASLLDRALAQFDGVRKEYEQARRAELLELVKKVSKQVIRMELTLHPDQLLVLAEEALAAMPGDQEEVRVLLNPEEYARIKDMAPERASAWRLVPDPKLALGECRVVTAHAEADIGCQQRLDSCMEALSEHLAEA